MELNIAAVAVSRALDPKFSEHRAHADNYGE